MPATAAEFAAFTAAGATFFEADLQVSPLGLLVSHYFPVPGSRGRLLQDHWRLRTAGREPLLDDVLAQVPAGARVVLDLKETRTARRAQLVEQVTTLGGRDRLAVSSPLVEDLAPLRRAGFETWRTLKNRRALQAALAGIDEPAVSVRHTLLDAAALRRLHEVVPTVIAWTVNSSRRAAQLRDWGVDGVTTDRLEVLRLLSG